MPHRAARSLSAIALAASGLLSAGTAFGAPPILRFETTQPGNVIATGNTLGLSKQAALNGPGTQDAIGTFITLDMASVDDTPANPGNPWPAGTTEQWQSNGSAATLTIPAQATVLYAELVWGGSHTYGLENVTANLDDPVTLRFGSDTITVTPDPVTSATISEGVAFPINYYTRSADVTDFVGMHLSGTYAVEGVPATQHELTNTTSAAGWTLIVVYRFDGEPIRNMAVFVAGDEFVDEFTTVDYAVDGFCAPPLTPFEGTIAISTIEGDANRTGDFISIGESAADPSFITLSGPNNPQNNFFCSQLNGPGGQLDTSGTFGGANHDAINGTNVSGARQGWDVTHVALSTAAGHLVADQTAAVLRTETNDDSYWPVLAGIAIDVNAPKFLYDQSTTTVDAATVTLGDTFTITVKAVNEGFAAAENVRFTLPLAAGLTMTQLSTDGAPGDIGGNMVTVPTNVDMGDILPNEERTVAVTIEVSAAQPPTIQLEPVWDYDYVMCSNDPAIQEQFNAQPAGVDYTDQPSGAGGAGGGSAAGGGSGDGDGDGGAGGGDGFDAIAQGGGLCTCTSVGAGELSGSAWMALGLVALLRRRRKAE